MPGAAEALHRQLDEVTASCDGGSAAASPWPSSRRRIARARHGPGSPSRERAPSRGWERDLITVNDAAFHLYSRGAVDFVP